MAYYTDEEDKQQDPNASQGQQTGPQTGIISGQGSSPSQATPGSGPTTNTPDNPGNFVGIQQYLDANKTQAGKLGDQVAGVVNNSANSAREGVNTLNSEANAKVQGVPALGQDVTDKIQNDAEDLTPDERSIAKNVANAKYTGPEDVTGLGDTYNKAFLASQKANQAIDSTGTEAGRMGLITQVNSRPRTSGENVFDNALLQAGGGREKLANAAQNNSDVKNLLGDASNNIQNQIGTAKTQTANSQADAYQKIQDSLNSWKAQFEPKVKAAQDDLVNKQSGLMSDIGDNQFQLTPENMALLGLDPNTHIFGTDLNKYITQASPSDINASNLASQQDYARYAALADLAGDTSGFLNPANANQAGTAPGININKDKLLSDIKAANDSYNDAYNNSRAGDILNSSYLQNPSPNGFDTYIPQALTNKTDLNHATPAELENYWIPLFQKADQLYPDTFGPGGYGKLAQIMQRSLSDWKANKQYNNVINPTK